MELVAIVVVVIVALAIVLQYNILPYHNLETIFNLKHTYIDTQYSYKNTNVKIWISKKPYTTFRTLTQSAKVSPILKGIKNLLDENMTFEDNNDASIAVKLLKLAWLFRNVINKREVFMFLLHVYSLFRAQIY